MKHHAHVLLFHGPYKKDIHLPHASANLLYASQVNKPIVLPSLSMNLTRLVIASGDSGREIIFSKDHDDSAMPLAV